MVNTILLLKKLDNSVLLMLSFILYQSNMYYKSCSFVYLWIYISCVISKKGSESLKTMTSISFIYIAYCTWNKSYYVSLTVIVKSLHIVMNNLLLWSFIGLMMWTTQRIVVASTHYNFICIWWLILLNYKSDRISIASFSIRFFSFL